MAKSSSLLTNSHGYRGYGAIDSLWQTKRGGFSIGGGRPVLTGPSIIEAEGAKSALEFAKEGIR
jgi:simple sugar transport system substrate-binding protein